MKPAAAVCVLFTLFGCGESNVASKSHIYRTSMIPIASTGFDRFELADDRTSVRLNGIDLTHIPKDSFDEPCVAVIPWSDELTVSGEIQLDEELVEAVEAQYESITNSGEGRGIEHSCDEGTAERTVGLEVSFTVEGFLWDGREELHGGLNTRRQGRRICINADNRMLFADIDVGYIGPSGEPHCLLVSMWVDPPPGDFAAKPIFIPLFRSKVCFEEQPGQPATASNEQS